MVTITCRCGHNADMGEFCRTPIGGYLPIGQFQCPKCKFAFRGQGREQRIFRHGDEVLLDPGKIDQFQAAGRL